MPNSWHPVSAKLKRSILYVRRYLVRGLRIHFRILQSHYICNFGIIARRYHVLDSRRLLNLSYPGAPEKDFISSASSVAVLIRRRIADLTNCMRNSRPDIGLSNGRRRE
jgi:hypothetical protein